MSVNYDEQVLADIKSELENAGIPTTGAYSKMILLVRSAIISVRMGSFDSWEATSIFSQKMKSFIKDLASRESFIIDLTQYK